MKLNNSNYWTFHLKSWYYWPAIGIIPLKCELLRSAYPDEGWLTEVDEYVQKWWTEELWKRGDDIKVKNEPKKMMTNAAASMLGHLKSHPTGTELL